MLCFDILQYFLHNLLLWFHYETQIGSVEALCEPDIE